MNKEGRMKKEGRKEERKTKSEKADSVIDNSSMTISRKAYLEYLNMVFLSQKARSSFLGYVLVVWTFACDLEAANIKKRIICVVGGAEKLMKLHH